LGGNEEPEKDRKRRFETVSELATDIERHLKHEPVVRVPRVRFIGSGSWCSGTEMAGGVGLVAIGLLTGFGSGDLAILRRKKARLKAEQISQFLKEMLEVLLLSVALGRDARMLHDILIERQNG